MNRNLHNSMMAQYATPNVSGDGLVSWEKGVKCVLPSVKLYGEAVQDGTPTPDAPIMPVCNDGVVVGRSRNLFDTEGLAERLLTTTGSSRLNVDGRDCVLFNNKQSHSLGNLPVFSARENTQYTIRLSYKADGIPETGQGTIFFDVYYVDGSKITMAKKYAVDAQDWMTALYVTEAGKTVESIRISYGAAWNWYVDIGSIQMVEGEYTEDTMPHYTPYWDGGQATVPELWAIPGTDIRDEWDSQTGWGVRRVGVIDIDGLTNNHKFNGTDGYKSGGYNYAYIMVNRIYRSTGVCSHFKCFSYSATSGKDIGLYFIGVNASVALLLPDDISGIVSTDTRMDIVNKINAYVASIVEETGQPVKIWYALAEPEPFYFDPARLTQPNGPGQIIQVSGSVPECPIEVNYLTHAGGSK